MKGLEQQVADWAATMPADETYSFASTTNCAMCQFLHASGFPVRSCGGGYWRDTDNGVHEYPGGGMESPLEHALRSSPSTFGALADRLANLGQSV